MPAKRCQHLNSQNFYFCEGPCIWNWFGCWPPRLQRSSLQVILQPLKTYFGSGREGTSLEVLPWSFAMDNSYLVLRLDLSHSEWMYLFEKEKVSPSQFHILNWYMSPSSTQRKKLALGHKSSANSKFFISAMLASGSSCGRFSWPPFVIQTCRQFLDNWSDLERYCGYRENNIPQLEDINR